MTDPPGEDKIMRLPAWARDYIADLRDQIEGLEDDLDMASAGRSAKEAIASLWDGLASRRESAGDEESARTARMAAGLLREGQEGR